MDTAFVANRRKSQVEEESAYAESTLAVESLAAAASWYDAAMAAELLARANTHFASVDSSCHCAFSPIMPLESPGVAAVTTSQQACERDVPTCTTFGVAMSTVLLFDERIVMSNTLPRPGSVLRMVAHFEVQHHVALQRHCSTISFAAPFATLLQHRIVLKVFQSRLVPSSLLHAAIGCIALHPQDLRVRVRLHALGSTVPSPWLCAHMLHTWAWPLGVRLVPMPPPSAQFFVARKTGHAYLALLSFDFGEKGLIVFFSGWLVNAWPCGFILHLNEPCG